MYNGDAASSSLELPSGSQGVVLQLGGGGLSQSITGLTPNGSYTLSVQAACYSGSSTTFVVLANGNSVLSVTPSDTSLQTYTTSTFTADGTGQVTIELENTGSNDMGLTNVTMQAI